MTADGAAVLSDPALWGLIVLAGLGTWLLRLSFIALGNAWTMPRWMSRGLRYVPPAVLAALVAPALVQAEALFTPAWDWTRFVAGLAAFAVAALTRRVILTLVVGMAVLLSLGALT